MKELTIILNIIALLWAQNTIKIYVNLSEKFKSYSILSENLFISSKPINLYSFEKSYTNAGLKTVDIIWNIELTILYKMFWEYTNVVSIDFIEFDKDNIFLKKRINNSIYNSN